jgi:hypothetical protein
LATGRFVTVSSLDLLASLAANHPPQTANAISDDKIVALKERSRFRSGSGLLPIFGSDFFADSAISRIAGFLGSKR